MIFSTTSHQTIVKTTSEDTESTYLIIKSFKSRKCLLNKKVLQTNNSSHDPIPLSQIPGLIPSSACLLVTHHYPINRVMQNPADRVLSTPFTGCFKKPCTWCSKINFSTSCSLMDEIKPLLVRSR